MKIKINWCLFKHKWEYNTQIVKDFPFHSASHSRLSSRPYSHFTLHTRQCQRCYKKQKAIGWGESCKWKDVLAKRECLMTLELNKAEKRHIKLNNLGI